MVTWAEKFEQSRGGIVLNVNRFYDKGAWRKLRREILKRDNFRCVRCGAYVGATGASRIDHIEPVTIAPHRRLDPTNLRTLCAICDNRSITTNPKLRVDKTILGHDIHGLPRDANHPWSR
jgi:5-methylcytosine-specific restriction endonuclease McrA